MRQCCAAWLVYILGISVVSGCGGGGVAAVQAPATVPFSGKVTFDGEPMKNAMVNFIAPAGNAKACGASAITDEQGKYELNITVGEVKKAGAVPGDYTVTIMRNMGMPDPTKPAPVMGAPLPPKYSDPGQTELKASVPAGGGSQDFTLTSQ